VRCLRWPGMPTLVDGLPGWGGAAALCARTRGEPSSARCEQRLSDGSPLARAIPCAPAPEYGVKRKRERQPAFLPAHPHAAQRAVPGWRGGLGRVGADLASAGSMRPPPSPARHVSTAWLATTKASLETTRHANTARLAITQASRETAHNHKSQAINNTPCQHDTTPVPNDNPETLAHSNMRIAGAMAQSRH